MIKKEILAAAWTFIAVMLTATVIAGDSFKKKKKEKGLNNQHEDGCKYEEEEVMEFEEDYDLDFEPEEGEHLKEYDLKLADIVKTVIENRILFSDEQVKVIQNALKRRADELRLINSLYGEVTAYE